MPTFATIMHHLKSPANVGTIVRTHVAMGGEDLVFVGLEMPWQFKKNTQAFSRRLERICEITYLDDDDAFFAWCEDRAYAPVAIEVAPDATRIDRTPLPERAALIVGHEGKGLPAAFMVRCDRAVVIPQFGPVPCLNVATSAAIAMYEFRRGQESTREIDGHRFHVDPSDRVSGP